MSTLSGDAARGAITTLGGQAIRFGLQVGSMVLLARLLTPADFGIVAMVTAIVGVANLIGELGLSAAAIQAAHLSRAQRSNLFWVNVGVGLSLGAATFLIAVPLSDFYGIDDLVDVTRALSIVFVATAFTAQFRAELTRRLSFVWLAGIDIGAQAIGVAVGIASAIAGLAYWAIVFQQITVAVVALILCVIGARWIPGLPSRADIRPQIRFGLHTLGVQVINYVSSNVDSILIGRFVGSAQLGYYDRAFQFFRIPLQQLGTPMTRVALPVLSRLKDSTAFAAYVRRAQLVMAYSMGGVFAICFALAVPIIEILLGPQWQPSQQLFRILAVGGVFQAIGYVYYWVFLSKGLTGLQLRFTIVSRSLMVLFMVVGVYWGGAGVAAGGSLGLAVNWLILTLFAIPRAGLARKPLVLTVVRPILVMSMAATATWLFDDLIGVDLQVVIRLCAGIGVFAAVVTVIALCSRSVRSDLAALADTVRRARR